MPYSLYRRGVRASGRRRTAALGPAVFGVAGSAGNGQSTMVDPLNITIPAGASAGQVAVVFVVQNSTAPTLATPSGWTLRRSDSAGTTGTMWAFTRTLQAGDPGSSVSLNFSTTVKAVAQIITIGGVTETGLLIGAVVQGTATGTYTLPTLNSVPAGSMLVAGFLRRRSGDAAANITTPAPYTEPGVYVSTAYGNSTTNAFSGMGYAVSAAGGTVGGEAGSTGVTSTGTNYLIALPPG